MTKKTEMKLATALLGGLALVSVSSCRELGPITAQGASGQRTITVLSTNDIHGGVEAGRQKGVPVGGMSLLAGAVRSIREGVRARHGGKAGVLLVDAGDQFQGTLLSNYDEGQLVFRLMSEVGYDAVVPGNHDYDFGPIGWLADRVGPDSNDPNPRGAIERLAGQANFPLISANTYLRGSLVGLDGKPVEVSSAGCEPVDSKVVVDWSRARRPGFLRPYAIKEVADVRVAMIGIDNPQTGLTTTLENVSDLCFRGEAETYLDMRAELEGKAQVFVMVMHHGNSNSQYEASEVLKKVLAARPGKPGQQDTVHLVVAGHTHFVNNERIGDVPLLQSGSGGKMFGRADIIYDFDKKQVITESTQGMAGVSLRTDQCGQGVSFCTIPEESSVAFDGVKLEADPLVTRLIDEAKVAIGDMAQRRLGRAAKEVTRDRILESPLANFVTDGLRKLSGAEVALINSSLLRANLPAGEVTYETLFGVLPISNRAVVVGPMPAAKLVALFERSIRSCGAFGSLMQSGLKVRFERDCKRAVDAVDPQARLLRIETLAGEVIFDRAQGDAAQGGLVAPAGRSFEVATLDFLADGGSGYTDFVGTPRVRDFGIFREALAEELARNPVEVSDRVDGRLRLVLPQ